MRRGGRGGERLRGVDAPAHAPWSLAVPLTLALFEESLLFPRLCGHPGKGTHFDMRNSSVSKTENAFRFAAQANWNFLSVNQTKRSFSH